MVKQYYGVLNEEALSVFELNFGRCCYDLTSAQIGEGDAEANVFALCGAWKARLLCQELSVCKTLAKRAERRMCR